MPDGGTSPDSGRPVLVAGLGNPGPQYEQTLHNFGFLAVDRLAERLGASIRQSYARAQVGLAELAGRRVILAKPQTFMNLSGGSVKQLLEKHELVPADLIVVYDELDLPWGSLRVRPKGSAGGHNGVQSIIKSIGTNEFARVRLGINPGHEIRDGASYVLSPFKRSQKEELDDILEKASQAVESIIVEGVEKSMTKFNRRAQGAKEEE
jgi:peptidyl-tRNA hydrolase, PTH1 family